MGKITSLSLGLNFFGGHDTSVFTLMDDDFFALSQERVTRIKHDSTFPIDAVNELIRYKKIDTNSIKELNLAVATKNFENRILKDNLYYLTKTLRELIKKDKDNLYIKELEKEKKLLQNSSKLNKLKTFLFNKHGRKYLKLLITSKNQPLKTIIKNYFQDIFKNAKIDITFYEHHLCHAYSTYFTSDFDECLIFTFDGEGDGCFSKVFKVKDKNFVELGSSKNVFIDNMQEYEFADKGYASVGNVYSIFTHLLGFTPNADEGKVEALAAFGDSNNFLYEQLERSFFVDKESLSIKINKDELNLVFAKENLKKIFDLLKKEDISAAVQNFTEDLVLSYLKVVKEKYPTNSIALAGGVTANVILNLKIYEELFENIHITPAMGDDGISQGAFAIDFLKTNPDKKDNFRFPTMPYFGSSFTKEEVEKELLNTNLKYEYLGDKAKKKVANSLVSGKIGAIFQGRAEFGPRALGNRSIIADVRNKEIQTIINKSIKNRPLFQPFCPSILDEEKKRLFKKAYLNKHMTIAFRLKDEFKEDIPGSVHVDLTARVQFVSKDDNPTYYAILKEVKNLTGFGVIINTSFNKHGRTMVLTPKDAITDFLDTNLDYMLIEGFFITR